MSPAAPTVEAAPQVAAADLKPGDRVAWNREAVEVEHVGPHKSLAGYLRFVGSYLSDGRAWIVEVRPGYLFRRAKGRK